MAKIKLSTSPQTTTITHIINSPTLVRISWDSDSLATVNISNVGTNLPPKGFVDKTISTNTTFIVDSINSNGLTNQRIINFIYQPLTTTPTEGLLPLLYQDGDTISLQNNLEEITLQG